MTAARPKPTQAQQQPTSNGPLTVTAWAEQLVAEANGECSLAEAALLRGQVAQLKCEPGTQPLPPDPSVPKIVRDLTALRRVAEEISSEEDLVIDLETTGLDHRTGEIVGLGLATPAGTIYFPTAHRHQDSRQLRPDQVALPTVVRELKLDERKLIAHNAKFELQWLRRHAGIHCQFAWDTMLAARLLRSDLSAKLEDVAFHDLDVPDWSLSKEDLARMQYLPVDRVARYCGKDCYYTLEIYRRQRACLV